MTDLVLLSTSAAHAPGWAFVLANASTIDRVCRQMCKDRRMDVDDLRQEAAVAIATHFESYDAGRAEPKAWIWWRVRRARQAMLERLNRRDRFEVAPKADRDDVDAPARDPEPTLAPEERPDRVVERRILVSQVLRLATEPEREVAAGVLAGLSTVEVAAALGLSSDAVPRARLRRLGERAVRHVPQGATT